MHEDNRKTCLIITGGEYDPLPPGTAYDHLVACDRGYEAAAEMGLLPDVIIGDFDSAGEPPGSAGIPVIRAPREKDDTDTMLAIRYALEHGYRHIILSCALGRRLDHTLSNIQSAMFVAVNRGICEIISRAERIRTLTPEDGILRLPRREGWYLSLFSLTEKCLGVKISGVKYPSACLTLTSSFPLGQSNQWIREEARISLKQGILLIVESKDR
ncbi:MAG: thiamine diphosphokinase [Lachnospiraceae bacterium]|nr:thiamine diphosphokinase [Lachnospiraceae bacterium]